MQPKLEKIFLNSSSSIAVKREVTPFMDYPLHYHPEYEIIYVEKSYGIRIMGNDISNFSDGDLMFIGPNLPHVWRNDMNFYQGNENLYVDVYVIHFLDNALGKDFFGLPEFKNICKLFQRSQQGVLIKANDKASIASSIKKVYESTGVERLTLFIRTLEQIAGAEDFELLSAAGYSNSINIADTERINKVINFIMENFKQEVQLDEVAALVNLNKASFCRYFKAKMHKTFSQFLNEIRVAHACKLLVDNDMTITQICYETGYNNISHFNRQFKLMTGLTAKTYSRRFLSNAHQAG